jgi:hypothetical protein
MSSGPRPEEWTRRELPVRVVDINALRALAPPSLPPVPRPSGPQARTPQPRWSRRHSLPDGGEFDVDDAAL